MGHKFTSDEPTEDARRRILCGRHRYQLVRELGHGGQGTVFEALDLDQDRRVALKLLRSLDADALRRFKREFRLRERVVHPSLVDFGELAQDGGLWFFTMGLVAGAPLLAYLEDAPSEAKLRSCFAQLASALAALHAAGLVHRDVKSDNVLVERSGRIMLLDLGLTVESRGDELPSTQLMGTPRYMAPEQWSGVAPAQPADWYAFGVLLFEAIAQRAPFEGTPIELLMGKTQRAAPPVRSLASEAPADLADLCDALLLRDPAARAGLESVRRCLPEVGQDSAPPEAVAALLGRHDELARLDAALAEARQGHCVLVTVEGPSGVGKTALLDAFVARARAHNGPWAFSGRCYEVESVHFNAFDEVLEGLAGSLRRLPRATLDGYRPRHAALLARVFPVLSFLVPQRSGDSFAPPDPTEVQRRAIRALHELLARMADESPVVLCLDDAQWADGDSAALIESLRHADFALLLVLGVRGDGTPGVGVADARQLLALAPLDDASTRELARRLAPVLEGRPEADLNALHAATGGSPFLVTEWARFVRVHGSVPTTAMAEPLRARIAALSPARRRLLSLVAVSREPLERSLATAISGTHDIADVAALGRDRLTRNLEREGTIYVDVYHERVREAALELLEPTDARRLLGEIAVALERSGAPAERRIAHQLALEDSPKAAALALESARAAERSLAFRRAAELYEMALTLSEPGANELLALCVDTARAWQNAHCPVRAADALLLGSRHARDAAVAGELLRRAGEQLLLGGDLSRGLSTLEGALAEHGLKLAASADLAVVEALVAVRDLVARGLEPASHPSERHVRERALLCLSLARCLLHVDLRGLPFAVQGLQLALDAGDDALLQQALATFVMVTAGHLPNPLVEPAFARCRALTVSNHDGYAQALFHLASAELEHFHSRYPEAERACERAEQILLERCVGVSRELGQVRSIALIMAHSDKGDFSTHRERALAWLEDADRRGDLFYGNWLRAAQSLALMAQDDAPRARAELARAEGSWPAGLGGTFETACALFLDALDRYEDRPDVHERPAQGRASVLRSPPAQSPLLQGYLHLQCAWGCLREIGARPAERRPEDVRRLRLRAQEAVGKLRALNVPSWASHADALAGNLALLAGARHEAAELLERAHAGFLAVHMAALAACAKRRRGEVLGGELGARWVHEADAELGQLGVQAPARFARTYFSPFAVDGGDVLRTGAAQEPPSAPKW